MAIAVAARNTGSVGTNTSQPVTLPNAGANPGDLYVVASNSGYTSVNGGDMTTSSAGWTRLNEYGSGTPTPVAVFTAVETGSLSLTITNTLAADGAWACFRITGANNLGVSVAGATGSGTTHTSPAITPAYGL